MHKTDMLHFRAGLLICPYRKKIKTWKIWESFVMMRKSLYFTDNQITKKWNNKIELLQTLVSVKYKTFLHPSLFTFCTIFCSPLREKGPNTDFFFSYFPVVILNTEIYSVNLCIQSKHRKIRTKKISIFAHFHAVHLLCTVSVSDFELFLRKIMHLPNQNKVFRADHNFIKEM